MQSETYDITDAKAIFNGVSYISSQGNIVDNGDGTYTIYPNPNNYCIFGFNSTTAQSDRYFADIGGAFEFDVVSYTGAITLRNSVSGGSNFNVNTIWDNNTHYKIEIIDNGVKFNGTVKTASDTGARIFSLRLEDGASITIKNLLYY